MTDSRSNAKSSIVMRIDFVTARASSCVTVSLTAADEQQRDREIAQGPLEPVQQRDLRA